MVAWGIVLFVACSGGTSGSATPEAEAPAEAPEQVAPAEVAPAAPPVPVSLTPKDGVEVRFGDPNAVGVPVVVLLHGLGDRPDRFVHLIDGWNGTARVLVPGAPVPWGDGGMWLDLPDTAHVPGDEDAKVMAGEVMAWIRARRRPDDGPTIVAGFSQGGMLAYTIGLLHADEVAGVVPIAGAIFPDVLAASSACSRVRAVHGDADTVVPLSSAAEGMGTLRGRGCDARLLVFPGVGHEVSKAVRDAVFRGLTELSGPG